MASNLASALQFARPSAASMASTPFADSLASWVGLAFIEGSFATGCHQLAVLKC